MATWKRDVASGLIVLVPLIITGWVVYWLYNFIQGIIPPGMLVKNPALKVALTLAIFALFVLAVGYLMRTALGSLVETAIDDIMNRVPGLRVVYNASKMAIETALSDSTTLQEPVKITTWNNIRMTAFRTGKRTADERELLFLPTAPNITSGYVIEVEEDDIMEIDDSVEDALTRILSAGFGERSDRGVPIDVAAPEETDSGELSIELSRPDSGAEDE